MNTTDFLSIAHAICPERNGIVFEGQKWTYAQLNDRINRLAAALHEIGVKEGDRVGIINVNCHQYIEAYYATAKLNGIFVPLNYKAKEVELPYLINNAEIKILFVGSRYVDHINTISSELTNLEQCICIDHDIEGMHDYEKLIENSSSDEVIREIGDEDITILMYTAGTTGRPKGVPLTHYAFVSYVLENVEPANPEEEERTLVAVPMYHVAGIQTMFSAIYGGRTMVLMRQFEVKEWLKTVERYQVTRVMLVPTMLKRVIDDPDFDSYDLTSLKVITYGAAPMPLEVISRAVQAMPWVRFINAFGQTETASTITFLGPEDHLIEGTEEEKEKKLKRLAHSIGRPLSDVEIKIVDERENVVPPLAVGEIVARGPRIMSGYWRDENSSSRISGNDGWLRLGDKGWVDEEGYIYLAGRGDDMIIRGGENISPEEVENVLYSHPKVEEAAVIGVPDLEWGQQPRAVVVLKQGEASTREEIIDYCRSRLSGFKRPRSVVFIDSLPRNQVGKVLNRVLREQYGQP